MDLQNPVVQLCVEGTRLEFEGKQSDARKLYWEAWKTARDDFEACIAAHYVARFQESLQDKLTWNLEALNRANAADYDLVKDFYPSLYLNLGHSFELVGDLEESRKYYELAARSGYKHIPDTF